MKTLLGIAAQICAIGLAHAAGAADGPGPQAPARLRIMNIGASISSGAHLQALQELLVAAGVSGYEFVGPVSRSGEPRPTDRLAYGGMRFRDMLRGRTTSAGVVQTGAEEAIPKYRPNVILLLGGTNNILSLAPDNLAPIQKEWNELIDFLVRGCPDARIFASAIPRLHPQGKRADKQAAIDAFTAWQKQEIAARAQRGQRICWVDATAAVLPEDFRDDGVHLLDSGQKKIGDAWFQALREHGLLPPGGG